MKLTFIGTRGEVKGASERHRMHSSLLASFRGFRLMIDCGYDWLGRIGEVDPRAIIITHAHPDHSWGIDGAPCPVYATAETWQLLVKHPVVRRRRVAVRQPFELGGFSIEAFPVEHSIRAPAVGYRVTAGRVSIFYAPDLVYIHDRAAALSGARVYIGDGATAARSMVRRRGDRLFGHTPMRTQLTWCQKEGVPRAIFTHCGSQIVLGEEAAAGAQLAGFAAERGVAAEIAHDGLTVILR